MTKIGIQVEITEAMTDKRARHPEAMMKGLIPGRFVAIMGTKKTPCDVCDIQGSGQTGLNCLIG